MSTKKPRLSFTDNIKIIVGKESRPFILPKAIICDRSPFFKAAASLEWFDGDSIKLPEDDPNIADIYFHCTYTGVVDVEDAAETLPGEQDGPDWERIVHRLARTWIFADKVSDLKAANAVMACMLQFSDEVNTVPNEHVVSLVAQALPTDSPLYRLFVDFYVHEADVEGIADVLGSESVPRMFLIKVLEEKTILEASNEPDEGIFQSGFTRDHPCRYYLHADEHSKCRDRCEKPDDEKGKEENEGAGTSGR